MTILYNIYLCNMKYTSKTKCAQSVYIKRKECTNVYTSSNMHRDNGSFLFIDILCLFTVVISLNLLHCELQKNAAYA